MGAIVTSNLVLDAVTVTYESPGGGFVDALRRVDLAMDPSEYVVVVGANGAGKSTLLKAIAGEAPLSNGSVHLGDRQIQQVDPQERSRLIARVVQDPQVGVFGELSLVDNLILGMKRGEPHSPFRWARTQSRRERAHELLAEYGRGLVDDMDRLAGSLSGGQRQLVALAMSIAQTPEVLLLDEHTSALDPDIGATVMEWTERLVRERQLTTVMVTHNMRQAAEYGDRVLIMSRGRIVEEIEASEKRALGADGLVDRFRATVGDEMTDRMLG